MALTFEPFSQAQLILGGPQEPKLLLRVDAAL
jgi:hypothetical protein